MNKIITILCLSFFFSCKSKIPDSKKESENSIENEEEYVDIIGLFNRKYLNYEPNSQWFKENYKNYDLDNKIAKKIKPSERGEFEISSVNQYYLKYEDLKIEILGRGFTWLDTGTHDSLLEASNFIKTVEKHSGYKVACLEEIAFKMKFINLKKLKELAKPFGDSSYGKYLKLLVNENQ